MSDGIRSISASAFDYIQPINGVSANAVAQFIPNMTLTPITVWQLSAGGFNVGGLSGGRFAVPKDGYYTIIADVVFDADSAGDRTARIIINDADITETVVKASSSGDTHVKVRGGGYSLSPGDFISIRVLQNSGGVLAITSDTYLSII